VALITPPVGLNLFVIQAIAKTPLGVIAKGVLPFILLMLLAVVLIFIFPSIVLWLPFAL
jgi:C4-dicarboxylate transporter, DctM subunit